MSFFDSIKEVFIAEVSEIIAHPIYLFTAVLPCFLVVFLLIKVIDFILYYIALNKYLSDDDKGENDDD